MCIITVLNQGLRNGGGVGDILRRPSKEVGGGGGEGWGASAKMLFLCYLLKFVTNVALLCNLGAPVCCPSGLRPSLLLRGHHHRAQPHIWCHHRHLRWPEERKATEGGDPQDHLFHLRWVSSREMLFQSGLSGNKPCSQLSSWPHRAGKGQIRQQDGVIRGAHQVGAQHVALPLLPGAGEGEGPHRVHRTRELRGPDDCGESMVQNCSASLLLSKFGLETQRASGCTHIYIVSLMRTNPKSGINLPLSLIFAEEQRSSLSPVFKLCSSLLLADSVAGRARQARASAADARSKKWDWASRPVPSIPIYSPPARWCQERETRRESETVSVLGMSSPC